MSRTVLVAGASSGIGLATALAFAEAGHRVHGAARRPELIAAAAGDRVTAHKLDVTDRAAVDDLAAELGALDVLVVAAGVNVPERRLHELTPEAWDEILGINLSGAFNLVHAFLEPLLAARGDLVLIGSVSGSWTDRSGVAYQASKAGLLALARGAGFDVAGDVRVTAVLPGVVDTAILDRRPEPPGPELRAQMLMPADVAAACLFVTSLPPRAFIPELTILPTALQAIGRTT